MKLYFSCFKILVAFISLLFGYLPGRGQITIEGPKCVIGETVYQYNINGPRDSGDAFQVCITGGKLSGLDEQCLTGKRLPSYIKVMWYDSGQAGNISVDAAGLNASLQINLTTPLKGGSIDSISKMQIIHQIQIPAIIKCSPPSGGSCDRQYIYQWQQSSDNRHWKDIDGAIGEELELHESLQQTNYYRREVTADKSNTVSYSDVALVIILK